jgi:hypothetical protein
MAKTGDLSRSVARAFAAAGWKVSRLASPLDSALTLLLLRRGGHRYVLGFRSGEPRPDRLVPLLAQTVLETQAAARKRSGSIKPLAVVGTDRVSSRLAEQVRRFRAGYADDVAIGLVDREGFRDFVGAGLEDLRAAPALDFPKRLPAPAAPGQLFSDLNQWMLKLLLAPRIPEQMLTAPRGPYRNASQLAAAAGVSVMTAFRLLERLRSLGFLEEAPAGLRLVRGEELMRQWQAACLLRLHELPAWWTLERDGGRLPSVLRSWREPRVCLGLHAAAQALGCGVVHGVPPHIYLEEVGLAALRRLGMTLEPVRRAVDVYLRIPVAPEAVFRGAVRREGVPVCDLIQVWLDVAAHPARGDLQAERLWRRFLGPAFEEAA